jgi:transposase InsO family protein
LAEENPTLPVSWLCQAFNLRRSSYYAAVNAKVKNDLLDSQIWQQILTAWGRIPGLGYRKLASRLKINGKKILRILRTYRDRLGHKTKGQRKQKANRPRRILNVIRLITEALLQSSEKVSRGNWILRHGKNKYRHIIEPTRPYQLWAGDWKELKIPVIQVTLYIFVIIDCYTREVMGWELSVIKDSKAAIRAGEMALAKAKEQPEFRPRKLIMHSDQGSAYTSDETIYFWRNQGVILSTADRGKPTQNPYIESFFSLLVRFWLDHCELPTVIDARESITHFFDLYNAEWQHGAWNYSSPKEVRIQYFEGTLLREGGTPESQ